MRTRKLRMEGVIASVVAVLLTGPAQNLSLARSEEPAGRPADELMRRGGGNISARRVGSQESGDASKLGELSCVNLRATHPGGDAEKLGITWGLLTDTLGEAVETGSPGLSNHESCSSSLYLDVHLLRLQMMTGVTLGYAAVLSLELHREVSIKETEGEVLAPVWSRKTLLSGPLGSLEPDVVETVQRFVGDFSSDLRRAAAP